MSSDDDDSQGDCCCCVGSAAFPCNDEVDVSQVQVHCPNEGDNETLIRKVRRDVVGMSFSKVQRNDHIFL